MNLGSEFFHFQSALAKVSRDGEARLSGPSFDEGLF